MSEENCLNCGEPASAEYDLLVRGNNHRGVPLCEECHGALQTELADAS